MAQLVNLKQRIKAAETIKKITHAMRLVSMSNNLKLRSKKNFLDNYNQEIKKLWVLINNKIKLPTTNFEYKKLKNLIIILSSEKGLCGNFNNALFTYYNNHKLEDGDSDVIIVGKEGITHLKELNVDSILNFPIINSANFYNISKELSNFIINNLETYNNVIVYSNWAKSFFIQKQKKTVVFPIKELNQGGAENNNLQDRNNLNEYIWIQTPESLINSLKTSLIYISISELIFDSLLAEQAARFISMDSATRNATDLINSMKLEYNKLRQAAITRELTELSGSN